MTYAQHWMRGGIIILLVALAAAFAALGGILACGVFVLFPLELFWHGPDWAGSANVFYKWAASAGAVVWMPFFVSQIAREKLIPDWPPKLS